MGTPPVDKIIYVPDYKLREIFNSSQYPDLIREKKLIKKVVRSRELSKKTLLETGFPKGTKSEVIRYRDPRRGLYVLVHRYLLPDGSIGASGKPDPKAILLDGTMYCFASPGSNLFQQS